MTWNKQEIREHALTFDEEIFKAKIRQYVESKRKEYLIKSNNVGKIL